MSVKSKNWILSWRWLHMKKWKFSARVSRKGNRRLTSKWMCCLTDRYFLVSNVVLCVSAAWLFAKWWHECWWDDTTNSGMLGAKTREKESTRKMEILFFIHLCGLSEDNWGSRSFHCFCAAFKAKSSFVPLFLLSKPLPLFHFHVVASTENNTNSDTIRAEN